MRSILHIYLAARNLPLALRLPLACSSRCQYQMIPFMRRSSITLQAVSAAPLFEKARFFYSSETPKQEKKRRPVRDENADDSDSEEEQGSNEAPSARRIFERHLESFDKVIKWSEANPKEAKEIGKLHSKALEIKAERQSEFRRARYRSFLIKYFAISLSLVLMLRVLRISTREKEDALRILQDHIDNKEGRPQSQSTSRRYGHSPDSPNAQSTRSRQQKEAEETETTRDRYDT